MSEQFDPNAPEWGGLQLGIRLKLLPPDTTEDDVRNDKKKLQQLKKTYRVLSALGVGKVNGKFVDTPRGLQEKVVRAATADVERRRARAAAKAATSEQ